MSYTFNLRDFGPRLVTFLDKPERLALRAACREGRVVVDRAITTVTTVNSVSLDQFAAFLDGVLSRGARPAQLYLLLVIEDAADARSDEA